MASIAPANDGPDHSRISISGHQVDLGESLHNHVQEAVLSLASRYFCRAADVNVIFSREGKPGAFCCTIRFHVSGSVDYSGRGRSPKNAYVAFAEAAEHVAKQLRRQKRAMREDKPVNATKADTFRAHSQPVDIDGIDMDSDIEPMMDGAMIQNPRLTWPLDIPLQDEGRA